MLELVELLLRDLPALERRLRLVQLPLEQRRVVELPLGLLEQLLRDPDRPAQRSKRQGQQAGQQAHVSDPPPVRTTRAAAARSTRSAGEAPRRARAGRAPRRTRAGRRRGTTPSAPRA